MSTRLARRLISRNAAAARDRTGRRFGVAVPLVGGGFRNAYGTKTLQKSAVVRVTAAGGAVGLGNIDPGPGYSTETIEQSPRRSRTSSRRR